MRALIAALLLAAPALAETPVTPEAFLDAVAGRTVTFVIPGTGQIVGAERFIDRRRTVWTRANGECAHGEVRAVGDEICFRYEDRPDIDWCWVPFEADGALHYRATDTGEVQRVTDLRDSLLGCDGEPMS
ncbi:hypothetical protein [uncultured Jannaschia sp.]|uniref:hypothetical protein n=1 Tax=uncultured Jannaschia sp. TaxID=293347 RepID=UPI002606E847|nr:hypothetical protein [uncultured Jannaschia sp.]